MTINVEAMSVEMPEVKEHPNRRGFRGVLTIVNAPSDRPPSGARGHRVLLERGAAERALPSLIGMAVDYVPGLDGHDARMKVGIITGAELVPESRVSKSSTVQRLEVKGYLFARDCPEIVAEIARQGRARLGMSYEIANVRVIDTEAPVWVASEFTFTGAAVLRRDKAAYESTSMELV